MTPGMKICIYGAGAIGGYLGAQLAGTDATCRWWLAGAHLAAMRETGPHAAQRRRAPDGGR